MKGDRTLREAKREEDTKAEAYKADFPSKPAEGESKITGNPQKNKGSKDSEEEQGYRQSCGKETVEEGLRRLAFGRITDAVRLLYQTGDNTEELDSLDLYAISELKRGKDGLLEVKFYDRLKALQFLKELEHSQKEEAEAPLYRALEKSARGLLGQELLEREEESGKKREETPEKEDTTICG